jgi:hypothetical protein
MKAVGVGELEPRLTTLMETIPFLTYNNPDRTKGGTKLLSITSTIRAWYSASFGHPAGTQVKAEEIVVKMSDESYKNLEEFLFLVFEAWGEDAYCRELWNQLNLTMCMWFYNNTVVNKFNPQTDVLTKEQFQAVAFALAANAKYLNHLLGRNLTTIHRAPTYTMLREVAKSRLLTQFHKKFKLPNPDFTGTLKEDKVVPIEIHEAKEARTFGPAQPKPCPVCGEPNTNRRGSYLCPQDNTEQNRQDFKGVKWADMVEAAEWDKKNSKADLAKQIQAVPPKLRKKIEVPQVRQTPPMTPALLAFAHNFGKR